MWFSGVCDIVLLKLEHAHKYWERGQVYAERNGQNDIGEPLVIVTKRLIGIPLSEAELDHLVRILRERAPGNAMTRVFENARTHFSSCRRVGGPVHTRLVNLAVYRNDLREVADLLINEKSGVSGLPGTVPGKGIWES